MTLNLSELDDILASVEDSPPLPRAGSRKACQPRQKSEGQLRHELQEAAARYLRHLKTQEKFKRRQARRFAELTDITGFG